ncbi:hypothetical protein NC800_15410 [Aquibacillus sp. 3ASR75-286]|nr:hypothetical protein [Terrihalobacillus insolitus]
MKVALIHMGYFIALIILSFMSFFVILGAGFGGKINTFVLFIPFVFSVLWLSDYIWRILSTKPDKIQLFHPSKNWTFISLFLSGIFTVYSLFLTALIPFPIESAPSWMFLGTPVILLFIWYWLLYRYTKNKYKSKQSQWMLSSLLIILSLIYDYQICKFYIINT